MENNPPDDIDKPDNASARILDMLPFMAEPERQLLTARDGSLTNEGEAAWKSLVERGTGIAILPYRIESERGLSFEPYLPGTALFAFELRRQLREVSEIDYLDPRVRFQPDRANAEQQWVGRVLGREARFSVADLWWLPPTLLFVRDAFVNGGGEILAHYIISWISTFQKFEDSKLKLRVGSWNRSSVDWFEAEGEGPEVLKAFNKWERRQRRTLFGWPRRGR